jgi:hypothetical protein
MKILFNVINSGLGNNGGSLTIIKSANTLTELGHNVTIIDNSSNKHTWTPLKAKHQIIDFILDVDSNSDCIIATSFTTVKSTLKISNYTGIKPFHWIRGWELWNMSENEIIKNVLNVPTIKLVNSLNLKKKLKKYNINSYLVRPGYDIGDLYPSSLRHSEKEYTILGGLYHGGKHRHNKRTDWILNSSKILKDKYGKKIKLYMFGADKNPNNPIIDKYISNPDIIEKNNFYNEIDIWLAPTKLEGLHMPPAEAMLTCCPVIGTNTELNGMNDYLIHEKTGIVTDDNLESFINGIELLIKDPMLRRIYGNEGHSEIYSIGNREKNMKKLIEILDMEIKK